MAGRPPVRRVTALRILAEIIGHLENADIPHMAVGSFASSFHGEPRSTQDIDLVIDPTEQSLERFLSSLDRGRFYVPEALARAEYRQHGQFNVIDMDTGWKIDLVLRKDRPFSVEEFSRRRAVTIEGVEVHVATPEDTVLAKLEWARMGASDRQLADAAAVLAALRDQIDYAYLDRWAEELGVTDLLGQARPAV
jgi:hypothetical protein